MHSLSETDICDQRITPALQRVGWSSQQHILREYTLRPGRVVVRGQSAFRDKASMLRADYVLFHKPNLPLAVVEAKDAAHAVGAGMQQAIQYPRVELTLQGQVLDVRFTRVLMARTDLDLGQVLLLDRVQKGFPISVTGAKGLRDMGLIEGRAPRYFISAKVADALGQKAKYIHQRGLDDKYYQRLVLDYLQQYGQATRADLDALLLRKLPDVLSAEQKANKIKNLMQGMKRAGLIQAHGPRSMAVWRLCTALDK